jgi:4-amino-4-deoxy-L-arabinose transferase-like glycosyltransferase
LLLVAALTLFRIGWLAIAARPLDVDEAQYWVWSLFLDGGYATKPPLVAWIIALSTGVFGPTAFGIKVGAPLLHAGIALILAAIAERLSGPRAALWTGVIYVTLPGVWFSATLMSTDPPMMLGWALALWATVHWAAQPSSTRAALIGLALGLGLLGKYTAIAAAGGIAVWLLALPEARRALSPLMLAALLAALLLALAPNLVWNLNHGFAAVTHVGENAAWHDSVAARGLDWGELGDFLVAQALLFGPVGWIAVIGALLALRRRIGLFAAAPARAGVWLLLATSVPILSVMIGQALTGKVNANWAVGAYLSLSVLAGLWLAERTRAVLLTGLIATSAVVGAGVHGWEPIRAQLITVNTQATDPFRRVRPYPVFSKAAVALAEAQGAEKIVSDDRYLLSQLLFYTNWPIAQVSHITRSGEIDSVFQTLTTPDAVTGKRVLYLSRRPGLTLTGTSITPLDPIIIITHSDRQFEVNATWIVAAKPLPPLTSTPSPEKQPR